MLSVLERKEHNLATLSEIRNLTHDGRETFRTLDKRLKAAYWILIGLSVLTFALGVTLILVSVDEAVVEDSATQSGISGGLGLSDLALLFLFRPVERIHSLMGDISQMAMAVTGYQAILISASWIGVPRRSILALVSRRPAPLVHRMGVHPGSLVKQFPCAEEYRQPSLPIRGALHT